MAYGLTRPGSRRGKPEKRTQNRFAFVGGFARLTRLDCSHLSYRLNRNHWEACRDQFCPFSPRYRRFTSVRRGILTSVRLTRCMPLKGTQWLLAVCRCRTISIMSCFTQGRLHYSVERSLSVLRTRHTFKQGKKRHSSRSIHVHTRG